MEKVNVGQRNSLTEEAYGILMLMKGVAKAYSHIRCWGRLNGAGFTVVEVLIVLAVTGLLFVSAAILIGGRQNQAEFDHGIQQVQSQIQSILNETSSGYYPNLGNFQCQRSGAGISITPGSSSQGTNSDCIFLGKIIEFGSGVAGGEPEKFVVHSLAGLRTDGGGTEILILKDTMPMVIPGASIENVLEGGINVDNMSYNNKTVPIGAVAIVSSLGQASSTGILAGSQHLNVIPIDGTALIDNQATVIATAEALLKTSSVSTNPANGVQVCFASNGTNQSGLLTIGSDASSGRELSITMDIKSGRSC